MTPAEYPTGRKTYAEKLRLEQRGYLFTECSLVNDESPMYVCTGYERPTLIVNGAINDINELAGTQKKRLITVFVGRPGPPKEPPKVTYVDKLGNLKDWRSSPVPYDEEYFSWDPRSGERYVPLTSEDDPRWHLRQAHEKTMAVLKQQIKEE